MLTLSNLFKSTSIKTALSGAIAALLAATPGYAFSLVLDRAGLNADDQVDWSRLGPVIPPQPFKVLPYSISTTSDGGLGVVATIPPTSNPAITPPLLFQTTPTTIPTNFANGDFILFTSLFPGQFPAPGNPGPLTILFNTPVAGAGAQLAVDDTFQFTASIAAFDSSNNLLGSFSAPGTSSLALDNSALFLGVLSDTLNIARLEFSADVPNRAIGINTLSISSTAVPEPTSVVAIGLTGFGLLLAKRRKS